MADYQPADNRRLTIGRLSADIDLCITHHSYLNTNDCINHTNILLYNATDKQCITTQHYQHVCRVCIYNYKMKICVVHSNKKYNFSI